jgi:hypothetical protein
MERKLFRNEKVDWLVSFTPSLSPGKLNRRERRLVMKIQSKKGGKNKGGK